MSLKSGEVGITDASYAFIVLSNMYVLTSKVLRYIIQHLRSNFAYCLPLYEPVTK